VLNDILPGWPLLKSGLLGHFFLEKALGPVVRALGRVALLSQRKGPPKVDTLRAVVKATKSAGSVDARLR